MKIFIDTADVAEIREAVAMGGVDGVTTNPSLIAQTGKPLRRAVEDICELVKGPVSAEVLGSTAEAMVVEGRELSRIHPNVVVKLPLVADGLRAARELTAQSIRTNLTLCFSATQGLMAAKAGASFVSPFAGRVDDSGGDGMAFIGQLVTILRSYTFETEVLVASVRQPNHVVQAALAGADAVTVAVPLFKRLIEHPLTATGLARFQADGARIPAS